MLNAWASASARLMATEGDRRRVRMEIERDQTADLTEVSAMDEYRTALGG
jgi:hypothetical protein